MSACAVVVGSSGQDGTLVSDLLRRHGFRLVGISSDGVAVDDKPRRAFNITSAAEVAACLEQEQPQHVYYLAAHHHSSEDQPPEEGELFRQSTEINFTGLTCFLEAIRKVSPRSRLFYAASSHIFGTPMTLVQDEATPLDPEGAYAITKAAGMLACRHYRKRHDVFAACGILYNHESPLRGEHFLSRKIVRGAARVKRGLATKIMLGDLDAEVDWGYAPDYVEAMFRILSIDRADEFIIASGVRHTVRDFAREAFRYLDLDYGDHVEVAPAILRRRMPGLVGNPARLCARTGWNASVSFEEMVDRLVRAELDMIDAK